MKTFEYLLQQILLDNNGSYFMQHGDNPILNYPSISAPLDVLGSEGWEMITSHRYMTSDVVNGVQCQYLYEFFFKREKS